MAETRTSIKFVRDFRIKHTETFNLLETSEHYDSTLFNDVQSVSLGEIAVKLASQAIKMFFCWHF